MLGEEQRAGYHGLGRARLRGSDNVGGQPGKSRQEIQAGPDLVGSGASNSSQSRERP